MSALVALIAAAAGIWFGMPPAMAIVGGNTASGPFPYLVALEDPKTGELQCTAVLINQLTVLTAWHCVSGFRNDVSPLVVRIGSTDRLQGGTLVALTGPATEVGGLDAALIHLAHPVASRSVRIHEAVLKPGTAVLSIGWGASDFSRFSTTATIPERARQLKGRVIQCPIGKFGFTKTDVKQYVCVSSGSNLVGTSPGDSGGPLLVRGTDGQWELAGTLAGKTANSESTYVSIRAVVLMRSTSSLSALRNASR
jgi:hypothetical protein